MSIWNRRDFLAGSISAATALTLPRPVLALGEDSKFTVARLKYAGDWNPRANGARRILAEVSKATSVEVRHEPIDLDPEDKRLFYHPFVWWAGTGSFAPLSEKARNALGRYLRSGGLLLVDDAEGIPGQGFDQSVRREIKEILPEHPLERLPEDHALFRSFFLVPPERAMGRLASRPFVEGITIDNWTPLIYTMNDLGGALARDPFGNWEYDCVPGGELQRSWALRLAVNVVLYSLTANYKKDQIHVKEILRRRRR
jgi:hypothetical protein